MTLAASPQLYISFTGEKLCRTINGKEGRSDQLQASYKIFRLVVDWMAPRICPPALPALPPRNLGGWTYPHPTTT